MYVHEGLKTLISYKAQNDVVSTCSKFMPQHKRYTCVIYKRPYCCIRATRFLCATADTAIVRDRPSVTRVDQSITVQARTTKFSLSAARKTLVSGTVKLFHSNEGAK